MTLLPAGTEVPYTVTWLRMAQRPTFPWPALPATHPATLIRAAEPPNWYFLALYDVVGRNHAWEDMHAEDPKTLSDWLSDPLVDLFSLVLDGWPQGFFVLDAREGAVTDLAYFGLVPEAVGQGLGTYLLRTAILTAWDREGIEALTVNTCTLDHPRALRTYQANGFVPVRREDQTRVLTRPCDLDHVPD